MTRILIIDGCGGLSAAVLAQLRGIAVICDSAGAEHLVHVGVDHAHDQVELAAWKRANLMVPDIDPYIAPVSATGKQKAQWKRERNGRR